MNRYAIYDTITGKMDGWYLDKDDPVTIIRDAELSFGIASGRLQVISSESHFQVPQRQVLLLPPEEP